MINPPLDANGEMHVADVVTLTEAQDFYTSNRDRIFTLDTVRTAIVQHGHEPTACHLCDEPCEFPYYLYELTPHAVRLGWLRFKCIDCTKESALRKLKKAATIWRNHRLRAIPSEIREWKAAASDASGEIIEPAWSNFCRQLVIDLQLELRELKANK